ncbi:ABC transporter G family member 2 [Spatholobus suberectus]|nr:ABC transporter G family member 2 [Spatholobus suberectus]
MCLSVRLNRKISFPATIVSSPNDEAKPNDTKILLNDIFDKVRNNEIMAVLSSSDSSKSTFINALVDRISEESLKGNVTLNGNVLESSLLKKPLCSLSSSNSLTPFQIQEKKPMSRPSSTIAKTVTGDEGHRGVSDDECRRISIEIDIIHDCIVLFLDESTLGLDSTSAFMVVKVL